MTDKTATALSAITALYNTEDGEYSTTEFVAHHTEELTSEDWKTSLGKPNPAPMDILGSLILVDKWASEDDGEIDTYDFSLPGEVTDYMLSVRFEGDTVKSVEMES